MESKQTIILNVRGFKYEILLDSLESYPNSRLGKLRNQIKNSNLNEISVLCDKFSSDLKEFFFNRDPFILNMILNYYQTKKLHMNQNECIILIKDELDYWEINDSDFDSCCQVLYMDKIIQCEELKLLENKIIKQINDSLSLSYGKFLPNIRRTIWGMFEKPNNSVYSRILFYFSISIILISTLVLSNILVNFLFKYEKC